MSYYVYAYLDKRKSGIFSFEEYKFYYEPFYIGLGQKNRKYYHLKEAKGNKNTPKLNKIRSIIQSGMEPDIIVIRDNLTKIEAIELEKYLISIIGRRDLGNGTLTNLTDGGEGTLKIIQSEKTKKNRVESLKKSTFYDTMKSDEYRKRLSKIIKEKMSSDNVRKKLSDNMKGEKNHRFGKTTSQKQKESVRKAHKEGKIKLSEEGRNKIVEANKKRKGEKNNNIRKDVIIYKLISPNNETFIIKGAKRLQQFCSEKKIQYQVLRKNIGVKLEESDLNIKYDTAKNTIGWFITIKLDQPIVNENFILLYQHYVVLF